MANRTYSASTKGGKHSRLWRFQPEIGSAAATRIRAEPQVQGDLTSEHLRMGEIFLVSEEIACKVDAQVREIIGKCYEEALKILQEHRALMDLLVEQLIEFETIEGDVFRQTVTQFAQPTDKKLTLAKT